jgi:membrane protease YdiL (CAAX protease family)
MSGSNAVVFALGYILLSGLIGFTFGMLYIKTNSLWGPFFAHTFNNTVLNLIHVRTKSGINEFLSIRVLLITVILLILVLLTKDYVYFKNEFTEMKSFWKD